MKRSKYLSFAISLIITIIFIQCRKVEIEVPFDIVGQYEVDSVEIASYISEKGYAASSLDTTQNLVVYTVLDEGDGETIEFDDIVSYYYAIKSTDDSVRSTNNLPIAIENELDSANTVNLYRTEKFTFAPSSWTVAGIFPNLLEALNPPYRDALVAITKELKVGGHGVMILPSNAYFARDERFSQEIFVVDILPVQVRKPN
ncbi:MAG: hypothetical protein JXR03_07430 [Cyclobacteriaceae bacterium]